MKKFIKDWSKALWTRFSRTILVAVVALLSLIFYSSLELWWGAELLIAALIVIVTGYLEYKRKDSTSISLRQRQKRLFDYFCHQYVEELRQYDSTARLNIMYIDRWPVEHWSTFRTIFSRYMDEAKDKHLGLNLTQGVCGEAVTERDLVIGNLEPPHASTYRLDRKQQEKTQDLTLIMSMPIKKAEVATDEEPTLTDEIIGVVNIDSSRAGAHKYYEETKMGNNQSLMDRQEEALREISEIASYIMS